MSALDTSAQLLLGLYEHSPCGFHSLDADGVFTHINNTQLNWLGYRREEIVGRMRLTDILTPEGRLTFEQNFPLLKATGTVRDLELDLVRKDGTLLPALVSATTVRNRSGDLVTSRFVVYDLTHRQRAEHRFRSILEAAPDAVLVCNCRGDIVLANAQVERVFGYRSDELQGCALDLLVPERFRTAHARHREAFFARPQTRSMGTGRELTGLHKDGTEFPVEISISPLQTDDGLIALATVRDVTARRLAADELRKSEDRYRSVVSAMAEGVVVQERNGTISACNESAERILGLSADQIKGRTSVDPRWGAIHEDGSPFPGNTHPSMVALNTGQRQTNVCMGMRKPDGATTWILINAEPIFYPGTKLPQAVVTTFSDITERKRLEEQLFQVQKLEAIGRLAGGIAHDFNNILSVILGHCELMAKEGGNDPRALSHTKSIQDSAERAAALTRQLLAFGRKQVMQMRSLELNEVVSKAEMLRRLIGENIELVLDLAPDLGQAKADPVHIEQVVMNLVVNARDAMPNGGKLVMATGKADLNHEDSDSHLPLRPGPYVMISVSDTGHGMDEATVTHLFEPFFTTKDLGRGTGLGLSIIYGIVRQSRGHICVDSEPGRGTTFKVCLPRMESTGSEKVEAPPPHPAGATERGSETILLIEDDEALREMLTRMLTSDGYTILGAATAEEALAIAEAQPGFIEMVLTDMILPGGVDGKEVSRQIKAQRPSTRVLLMSGYSESLVEESSEGANVPELLEKPFSSAELHRKVRAVLSKPS